MSLTATSGGRGSGEQQQQQPGTLCSTLNELDCYLLQLSSISVIVEHQNRAGAAVLLGSRNTTEIQQNARVSFFGACFISFLSATLTKKKECSVDIPPPGRSSATAWSIATILTLTCIRGRHRTSYDPESIVLGTTADMDTAHDQALFQEAGHNSYSLLDSQTDQAVLLDKLLTSTRRHAHWTCLSEHLTTRNNLHLCKGLRLHSAQC